MILAAREFAENKKIKLNEGMFLSGWSEGGAVSVATQKLIEEKYQYIIKLEGASSMSGMLNSVGNMKEVLTKIPYISTDIGEAMDFIAWLYYSYNKLCGEKIPFCDLFKCPVNNQLDVLKNRKTNIPSEFFNILKENTYLKMMDKAKINDLIIGWTPKAPLFIHHGTSDVTVPFDNNAEIAVDSYVSKGSKAKLIRYDGDTHSTLALRQMKNMIKEFERIEDKNYMLQV